MLKSNVRSIYRENPCVRFAQGDIFRDLNFTIVGARGTQVEIRLPYVVILSQDCDLEQGYNFLDITEDGDGARKFNQYLPNILFAPAFQAEILRAGTHLLDLYKVCTEKINSDNYKRLKKNEIPRYHYLPSFTDEQIPELVIDFKAYYTLPFEYFVEVFKQHYFTSLNELFRESLSQRFASYLNRVGLPEL